MRYKDGELVCAFLELIFFPAYILYLSFQMCCGLTKTKANRNMLQNQTKHSKNGKNSKKKKKRKKYETKRKISGETIGNNDTKLCCVVVLFQHFSFCWRFLSCCWLAFQDHHTSLIKTQQNLKDYNRVFY